MSQASSTVWLQSHLWPWWSAAAAGQIQKESDLYFQILPQNIYWNTFSHFWEYIFQHSKNLTCLQTENRFIMGQNNDVQRSTAQGWRMLYLDQRVTKNLVSVTGVVEAFVFNQGNNCRMKSGQPNRTCWRGKGDHLMVIFSQLPASD